MSGSDVAFPLSKDPSPLPTYVHHNFDAVDKVVASNRDAYVEAINRQAAENEKLRSEADELRSRSTFRRAKAASIVILSLAVSALIVLWGVSLFSTVGRNQDAALVSTRNAAQQKVDIVRSTAAPGASVFDYVIFKSVPFNIDGLVKVTIGMQYASSVDEKPSEQWCYVERGRFGASGAVVWLANYESGKRTNRDLRDADASALNTSLETLRRAQAACDFVR